MCHACLREVPRSVATTAEGSDYVLFFCGAGCFAKWRGDPEAASPGGPE